MTRIVLLANSVTELGGAQRVVHMLADGFARRGHEVTVIGILPTDAKHVYVTDPSYRCVTMLDDPLPPPVPTTRRARFTPSLRRRAAQRRALRQKAVAGIADELASGPPGVLIVAQVWAMEHLTEIPSASFDARSWGVVAQYHGSFAAAVAGRDLARILRNCSSADAFAALTDEDARAFRAAGLNNVVTVPNPLPFWPSEPADGTSRRLLFLGRLAVEKAPSLLLDAWQQVNAQVPQWSLDLVGSGPLMNGIALRAAALPRVRVLSPVVDSQAVLLESGAFVLPSLTEGSPLAMVEAMACGVPVVATDCAAGVRELIDDETGLLVRSADVDALASALLRLLGDAELRGRLAAAARSRVAGRTIEATLDRWERLIEDVLR